MKRLFFSLLAFAVIVTGCLTSEEPFYEKGDMTTDDRLVGAFQVDNEKISWKIQRNVDHPDRYLATLVSDVKGCQMRFSAVLFQLGTKRFLDLWPILDSCDDIPGTVPGPIQAMQSLTLQPLHLVVTLEAFTNGLRFGRVDQPALVAAAKKHPEFFQARLSEVPRMLPDTAKQREFLLRFGSDTNLFKPADLKRVGG